MGIQCVICEELLESGADPDLLRSLPNLEKPVPSSSSRGSRNKSRKSVPVSACPKDIVSTPCGHLFHEICLQNWFKNGSTCPACRKPDAKCKLIKIFLSLPSEAERDLEKELADAKVLFDKEHKDKDELELELKTARLEFADKSKQLTKQFKELQVHLVNLSELGLNLCSFDTFGMRRSTLDVNLLNDFLKLQASSLQKLNVKFYYEKLVNTVVTIHLPKMQMLKEFNYTVGNVDKENIKFESKCLALNFSNLKTFAFFNNGYMRDDEWSKFMDLENEHRGIETLHVKDIRTSDRMLQLVKLFPNVCKLTLTLTSIQTLMQVWKWTKLESLQVKASIHKDTEVGFLDEFITGIPTEKHEELKRLMSAGVNLVDLDKVKTQRGISDFKNLYEFTLDITIFSCAGVSASSCITDISGHYGFAFARQLRTLKVFPVDGISTTCRRAIQNALEPNASIHFQKEKPKLTE